MMEKMDKVMKTPDRYLERFGKALIGIFICRRWQIIESSRCLLTLYR